MASAAQLESFNDRLARIGDPANQSYFDPESGMNIPKRVSKKRIMKNTRSKPNVAGVLCAPVLGAVMVLVVNAVFFHIGLVDQWYPALTLLVGLVAAILVGSALKMNRLAHFVGKLLGAVSMMAAMHNLVLLLPEPFALAFSPQFVANIQATTELGSLIFLGQSYSL